MFLNSKKSLLLLSFLVLSKLLAPSAWGGERSDGAMPGGSSAPASQFHVKPSDIHVPDGVPLGQYLRIARPFENWTLICDENLAKKQRVCNVSQTIVDASGASVFSWSLAAAEDGKPLFILRVPPVVGEGDSITLDLADGGGVVQVPVKGCNTQICLAYQPVGPRFKAAVAKARTVQVSFGRGRDGSPGGVTLSAPLAGLSSALDGI